MHQDVEIIGDAVSGDDATVLGGVAGSCELDIVPYSGRKRAFCDLDAGDLKILKKSEIVDVLVYEGEARGKTCWSVLRLRAGSNCHLSGPLRWRPAKVSAGWEPTPSEGSIMIGWVQIAACLTVLVACVWSALAGLNGGLAEMVIPLFLSGVSLALVERSRRKLQAARRRARLEVATKIGVLSTPAPGTDVEHHDHGMLAA
ncbi:hypothetical protein [Roseivivax sp. CAU 1761]